MANIKTITITDVTQPQINAAFIALTSATKGLEVDIKAVDSAWKAANKDLQQQIESIRRGTIVYSAGANINISSTGVISATVPTKTSQLQNDSGFITSASIPTNVSAFNNDAGYITSADIPTDLSDFNNDVGYITGDYIQPELFLCTTAYSTAAKTATSAQASTNFSLVDGRVYQVFISRGNGDNNSTAVTMKLNNAPAIPVYLGDHVLAVTRQFPIPQGIYYLHYHAATSTTEAYFRIWPANYNLMDGYQLLGNYISLYNTQYHFNRNFIFILHAQTEIGTSVTLTDWAGSQTTASIIINGNTTAGLRNPRTYFCYFHYDATNGHKIYTSTEWINFFGLTGDSGNAGKLDIQLYNRLTTYGSQYKSASTNSYGLDLSNSDIIGINGIYTDDAASGYSEGINFYRDATHNDSVYANGGHFYFGSNVQTINSKGSETTGNQNSDATLHAASFIQNGNNVWDNSRATSFAITVPSTAGTYASHTYTFTAGHAYTFGITGAWSNTTYVGSATFVINSTSWDYNIFLFSSSGSMTGTTVKIQPSSTAFKITGINGSNALGHQMTVTIIDYNK